MPGFVLIVLTGLLLLRVRKRYAETIVDSSSSYWELVDVFLGRRRNAPQRTRRLPAAERQRRQLEVFFLVLGVALVLVGLIGFAGLIPHERNL